MSDDDRPPWDEAAAHAMIGAIVLIGITRRHPDGDVQEQMHGVIQTVDAANGVEIILSGPREGESFWLPPHLESFEPAPPGEYRLRSTGETVIDPEYISQWTVDPPPN